jgi:hypothetical protein
MCHIVESSPVASFGTGVFMEKSKDNSHMDSPHIHPILIKS